MISAYLAAALVLFLVLKLRKRLLSHNATKAQPTSDAKATRAPDIPRPFGVWPPVAFAYPVVEPWTTFDVDKTRPIPFRPFRWGPIYPINMGIRPMPWNDWIQLDNEFRKTHAIRLQRANERKERVTRTLPGFRPHALEVLCEIASFLAFRYPQLFVVTRSLYAIEKPETHGDSLVGASGGAVTSVRNLITGELFDFAAIEREEGAEWNPMRVAGLLVQDDLAVMVEGSDGQYYFQAGSVCTPGFWRLEDKIGLPLEEIHSRGAVPQWREKLKFSMERFFQKMKVDKPVQRNNYFFQIDDQLAWSKGTVGPEDTFDQGSHGPSPDLVSESDVPAPATDPLDVWFRTERQTLRRMPKTGAILFTVRTYFHKVADIASEPGVPGRMASAIRSWPEDVATYKGSDLYTPVLLPYLDRLHEEQVASGLVEMTEEGEQKDPVTAYPF